MADLIDRKLIYIDYEPNFNGRKTFKLRFKVFFRGKGTPKENFEKEIINHKRKAEMTVQKSD